MTDSFGRVIDYLRVSVIDRCNLRCRYCMPAEGVPSIPHGDILTFDEITRVVRIMKGLGVARVRLTGGEPLVRKDVAQLAKNIKQLGIGHVGVTTNGVLLAQQAPALLAAGVDGLNLSLDTTSPKRYAHLTRRDEYAQAMAGLQAALRLPFVSVKVNAVLAPESRPNDWLGVVALAQRLPLDVRLIEWMPLAGEDGSGGMPADEALAAVAARFGALTPLPGVKGGGPAVYYSIRGFTGRVGMIPAITHCFCAGCNRVRLTARGDLKLCLFYDEGIALKPLLRGGASDEEIRAAIEAAVQNKPLRHKGRRQSAAEAGHPLIDPASGMSAIGG